jgi:hypothetical protein
MKTDPADPSEMLETNYQIILRQIPGNLHIHRGENLISHIGTVHFQADYGRLETEKLRTMTEGFLYKIQTFAYMKIKHTRAKSGPLFSKSI